MPSQCSGFHRVPLLRGNRVRRAVGALLAMLLFSAAPLAAADPCGQVWLLSTREAPVCGDLEAGRALIQYWRLGADAAWQAADAAAFHQGDSAALPTTIFLHGNRIDPDAAIEEAWCLYQHMQEQAAGRPFRLLIWSWPSERTVRGIRADVLEKADFSDAQSYYLARFLADVRPDVPVSLIGYSLGARAATGALDLLCGGSIADRCLPAEVLARTAPRNGRPYRVVLVAAANDADWLLPGHRDGQALALVERMLVTTNACDRVLRRYPRLYGRGGPEAMGAAGAYCDPQPGSCDKIEEIDVACSVGRPHDWYRYAEAPELVERLGWYTFLDAPPAGPQLTTIEPRKRP